MKKIDATPDCTEEQIFKLEIMNGSCIFSAEIQDAIRDVCEYAKMKKRLEKYELINKLFSNRSANQTKPND